MAFRSRLGVACAGLAALMLAAAPAEAQLYWNPPDFSGPPVKGDEPGITIPLPGATPAELSANLLWNMRAGLNVAALQCQFAPTLMTVKNYNAVLAHHGPEFAAAFTTLGAYFKRTKGKGGQNALDQYTTRTYNGFSTLYAQRSFCQVAGAIGADALTRPKGKLILLARGRMQEFRNSLTPASDRVFMASAMPYLPAPRMDDACWTKRDELKPECDNWRMVGTAQAVAAVAR